MEVSTQANLRSSSFSSMLSRLFLLYEGHSRFFLSAFSLFFGCPLSVDERIGSQIAISYVPPLFLLFFFFFMFADPLKTLGGGPSSLSDEKAVMMRSSPKCSFLEYTVRSRLCRSRSLLSRDPNSHWYLSPLFLLVDGFPRPVLIVQWHMVPTWKFFFSFFPRGKRFFFLET